MHCDNNVIMILRPQRKLMIWSNSLEKLAAQRACTTYLQIHIRKLREMDKYDATNGSHLFFRKTSDLLINCQGSTENIKSKKYIQFCRPPSDVYKHWSEAKTHRHPRPSLIEAGQTLLQ